MMMPSAGRWLDQADRRAGTTVFLTGFMAQRYWRSVPRKFMPSGLVALLSFAHSAAFVGTGRFK